MKKIILLLPLFLAGCASGKPFLISTQQVVILPPQEMYRCPQFQLPSNPDNLKDSGVAKIIAAQHQNNIVCRNSLNAIKMYLTNAQREIEQK